MATHYPQNGSLFLQNPGKRFFDRDSLQSNGTIEKKDHLAVPHIRHDGEADVFKRAAGMARAKRGILAKLHKERDLKLEEMALRSGSSRADWQSGSSRGGIAQEKILRLRIPSCLATASGGSANLAKTSIVIIRSKVGPKLGGGRQWSRVTVLEVHMANPHECGGGRHRRRSHKFC